MCANPNPNPYPNSNPNQACVEFWELSKWVLTSLLGERHEGSLARVVAGVLTHVQEGSALDVPLTLTLTPTLT